VIVCIISDESLDKGPDCPRDLVENRSHLGGNIRHVEETVKPVIDYIGYVEKI